MSYSVEEINRVAWQGEFPYHGVASGVDNTASTYGRSSPLSGWRMDDTFRKDQESEYFEIVLANSGVTVDTAAMDEFVDQQKTGDRSFSQRVGSKPRSTT